MSNNFKEALTSVTL